MNRAALAPFGHLTWTAILGGALFATAWSTGRFRLDRQLVLTFLGVMVLHALWDMSDGLSIRLTQVLAGADWTFEWPNKAAWVGTPTGADLVRFNVIYSGLLVINAVIGISWALRRWRRYRIDRWAADHPRP
jgi:protease PrsW